MSRSTEDELNPYIEPDRTSLQDEWQKERHYMDRKLDPERYDLLTQKLKLKMSRSQLEKSIDYFNTHKMYGFARHFKRKLKELDGK